MNILIFGPPGSGKGTYSKIISEKYNLLHISTGEILRKYENSDYINKIILSGELINDEIIFKILKDYIKKNINNKYYYKNNIIFDGFPRTYNQALYLNKYIKINIILKLNLDNELIFNRILGRKIHKKSGRIYHDIYNPSVL
ncbi:adenylate kinase family protein [Candidatus Nardonella dryophthoridicola]|uniref:Adenylate kinase n=1 Tax=endosymbiont of Metamasius hemipterus TaxID=204627 RepID=A0ABT0TWE1_9GAMM|nr:nucleoside monophosphate kinase [Candidatus Nardonella dryophthoridicola]MCM0158313.1 nucleoside monophosphate kinase [endosymbiont of Metamasius hemipterus]